MKENTKNRDIRVLLHNIRSVHNVGSMFRTADSALVNKIYLSGHSPTPLDRFKRKRNDLAKVALGAEENVPWESVEDIFLLIKDLKRDGFQIISVEQSSKSVDYKEVVLSSKVLLIMGNEVEGVDKRVLKMSDIIAEIPMRGSKESLNVSVSFGIALFRLLNI